MKLSENMLNFLGYAVEEKGFVSKDMAVGLAYPFGVASAVKNGLIEPHSYTWEGHFASPIPGVPSRGSVEGYQLTERGRALGEIGKRMRDRDRPGGPVTREEWAATAAPYVREGQAKLKEWGL
jgi:hypothetical protein